MVRLSIHLQEGFAGDEVIIEEGKHRIYHKRGVTTHPMLGLADQLEQEFGDYPITLNVSVPDKGLSRTIELKPGSPSNLALSIQGGKLTYHLSETEFGYM